MQVKALYLAQLLVTRPRSRFFDRRGQGITMAAVEPCISAGTSGKRLPAQLLFWVDDSKLTEQKGRELIMTVAHTTGGADWEGCREQG